MRRVTGFSCEKKKRAKYWLSFWGHKWGWIFGYVLVIQYTLVLERFYKN
jgi:hypothetical protein